MGGCAKFAFSEVSPEDILGVRQEDALKALGFALYSEPIAQATYTALGADGFGAKVDFVLESGEEKQAHIKPTGVSRREAAGIAVSNLLLGKDVYRAVAGNRILISEWVSGRDLPKEDAQKHAYEIGLLFPALELVGYYDL